MIDEVSNTKILYSMPCQNMPKKWFKNFNHRIGYEYPAWHGFGFQTGMLLGCTILGQLSFTVRIMVLLWSCYLPTLSNKNIP